MKIAEIVDPSKKTGVGKTGKPYTLMTIMTDEGVEADIFAPAVIGDEIELEQTQWGYTAKKLRPRMPEKPAGDSMLTIMKELHKINQKLDTLVADLEQRQSAKLPTTQEVEEGLPF